jgi:hypothetical protein
LEIHQFHQISARRRHAVTLLAISTTGVIIYGKITRKEERYATVTAGYRLRADLGAGSF